MRISRGSAFQSLAEATENDDMEKFIPEHSVRKSDLTQQAKVQVEQKFFEKSFCKFEIMCAQFLM